MVPREVTLLPRHWDWLAAQPGGASVALRKLVEQARRDNEVRDRKRERQEAAYLFMCSLAGNLPGFEEATRALYADDRKRYAEQVASWPGMSATMPRGWRGETDGGEGLKRTGCARIRAPYALAPQMKTRPKPGSWPPSVRMRRPYMGVIELNRKMNSGSSTLLCRRRLDSYRQSPLTPLKKVPENLTFWPTFRPEAVLNSGDPGCIGV